MAKNRSILPDGSSLDFTSSAYRLLLTGSSPEITKIPSNTTTATLLSGLSSSNTNIKVFSGANEANPNSKIGTGMIVQLFLKSNGNLYKTLTLVVTGDINGDGSAGLSDLILLKSHLLGKTTLSGAAAEAAEISGGSQISLTDYVQFKSYLLGKSSITPR